jgi:hypothetical protein
MNKLISFFVDYFSPPAASGAEDVATKKKEHANDL